MKNLLLVLLVLNIVLYACSMPEIKGTAIILGVSTYNISGIPDLNYCDDDARDIAELFTQQGYTVYRFIDSNATRANLEIAIKNADVRKPVVIFYSGHGAKIDFPTNGVAPGYYMLPYGFAEKIGSDIVLRREYMLATSDIESMAQKLGIKHCIIIADCCYSGGLVENWYGVSAVPNDYDPTLGMELISYAELATSALGHFFSYSGNQLLTVIAASGSEEYSFESGAYENGVFTEYFLRGVTTLDTDGDGIPNNADRDRDGYITTSELYLYIAQCMNKFWNSSTQSQNTTNQIYLPHISDNAREYILFKVKR